MRHDWRHYVVTEAGTVHLWRSHRPFQAYCGQPLIETARVVGHGIETGLPNELESHVARFCQKCSDKDDRDGFAYYHADKEPEPLKQWRFCTCGHRQGLHRIDYPVPSEHCQICECKGYNAAPLDPGEVEQTPEQVAASEARQAACNAAMARAARETTTLPRALLQPEPDLKAVEEAIAKLDARIARGTAGLH